MINIVSKRYLYFGISLLVIVPGLIALILWGFPVGIDFSSGSLLQVKFESGVLPQLEQIRAIYDKNGYPDSIVQSSGTDTVIIRSKTLDENVRGQLITQMQTLYGADKPVTVLSFENVSPAVSQEVARSAGIAVLFASIGIMGYITIAFRKVPHAFRYGVAAVIAMLHDVLVVVGIEAIIGHFLGWEVDALFLTALLTVIGFSVHDTIVVFDRIRENSAIYKRLPYEQVVNHSIVQTLARSINTQLTVLFTLFALALFGGVTIRHFVMILLIGVLSGTYSSIFNAAPILVVWENREWKTWFRRSQPKTA